MIHIINLDDLPDLPPQRQRLPTLNVDTSLTTSKVVENNNYNIILLGDSCQYSIIILKLYYLLFTIIINMQ